MLSGRRSVDTEFHMIETEVTKMKKLFPALTFLLATLMLLSLVPVFAEQAPSDATASADPLVGAWRMPASPFDDDFTAYVVLNADGSFLNATNLYESGTSGPYTQTITTNETFYWVRTGSSSIDLHYSYLDDNGEFVTSLTYNPKDDAFYFYDMLYAVRDDSFELLG